MRGCPRTVLDEAVAGDHGERAGDRGAGLLFGAAVDDHGAAGSRAFPKLASRQPLAASRRAGAGQTGRRASSSSRRRAPIGSRSSPRRMEYASVVTSWPRVAGRLDRREERVELRSRGRELTWTMWSAALRRGQRPRSSRAALADRRACGCGPTRRRRPRRETSARSRTSARPACRRSRTRIATAPCASPSRRMASIAAICASVAAPLPPMPAGSEAGAGIAEHLHPRRDVPDRRTP